MSLAADIREYALGPMGPNTSVFTLPHALVESFLAFRDWELHSLWSVEWRTFALLVAEAVEPSLPRADLHRVARYLKADNDADAWLAWGEWQRLSAVLFTLAEAA